MREFTEDITHHAMQDDRWDIVGLPQNILDCLRHPLEHFSLYGYEPLLVTVNLPNYWMTSNASFSRGQYDSFWNPRPSTVSRWYVAWNPDTGWKWLNYKPCYQQRVMHGSGKTFIHELEHRADIRRCSEQLDASWAKAVELGLDQSRMGSP
jgi:hypothetical protein